jgi:hypothetical protein
MTGHSGRAIKDAYGLGQHKYVFESFSRHRYMSTSHYVSGFQPVSRELLSSVPPGFDEKNDYTKTYAFS